jgi:hypothetical protein
MEKVEVLIRQNQPQSDTPRFGQTGTMTQSSTEALEKKSETTITERRKAVMMILERLHLDMSLPPLDERMLLARAASWEEHLTGEGCKPKDYGRIYKLALSKYTNNAPFNIYDLLNAWRQIREVEHRSAQIPMFKSTPWSKEANTCKRCNGTTVDCLDEQGNWKGVSYIEVNGRSQTVPCPECEGTGEQRLTELKEGDHDD